MSATAAQLQSAEVQSSENGTYVIKGLLSLKVGFIN